MTKADQPGASPEQLPPIAPRPERAHIKGFTIPFMALRLGALHFLKIAQAAQELPTDPEQAFHWDTYARAAQVFAAMAAEAQLNTYGLVRFGEELYAAKEFRSVGAVKRLKRIALRSAGVQLADDDPLVLGLRSLMAKRNPIVHMQADEEVFNHDGQIIRAAPPPPELLVDAPAAIQEMEAFLQGFAAWVGRHDIENWTYAMPW